MRRTASGSMLSVRGSSRRLGRQWSRGANSLSRKFQLRLHRRRPTSGRSAVGMHAAMDEHYRPERLYEIVGVVKDARYFNMKDAVDP